MNASSNRRGLSLMEMMISLSMLTVILGASISLILISARAMSSEASNVGSDAVVARAATDQILDDLKMATAITEQTSRAITMKVPDRDGDNAEETIRYAWSGVAGAPLTRQYNARAAATLATNVTSLNFSYLAKTAGKPPPVTSPTQTLYEKASTIELKDLELSNSKSVCAYVQQTLPENTISRTISRVRVQMRMDGVSTGTISATLHYADANKAPTGPALQTASVAIVSLVDAMSWVTFDFSTPPNLDPKRAFCVVLKASVLLGKGARVSYHDQNNDGVGLALASGDGGVTWAVTGVKHAIQMSVIGTATTQEEETLDFQPLPGP